MIPYGHQSVDKEDIDAVVDILKSDWLTTGPAIPAFEQSLCRYTGAKTAVAVNSATSALDIAVQALGLPPGSEIITSPFTFAATNNAILYNGHVPVFADIRRDTRNIDPDSIRKKITGKTRALMVVDYAGHPCDLAEIKEIARENDLYLIEDAAHALGAAYNGKKIGTFADITVFSFHPVKPITTGEGGAAMTDNPDLADRLMLLRSHGIRKPEVHPDNQALAWQYDMELLGRNYRLTDIQAALGLSQMKKIDRFIRRRNELARWYNEAFADLSTVELPEVQDNVMHGWHLYTILAKTIDRNDLFGYLRSKGIGVNVHYIPTYRFSYYRNQVLAGTIPDLPVTEDVFNRILTLPLHPGMSDHDMESIQSAVKMYGDN